MPYGGGRWEETHLSRMVDGTVAAPPLLCSPAPSPNPASSPFMATTSPDDDDEEEDEEDDDGAAEAAAAAAAVARFVRRSSLHAMASQMNGDSNENVASNSATLPSSLMFSSIATYSNPFCKNVINAPGGISEVATVDFAINDSCAKQNAVCAKPFSTQYLYISRFTSSALMDMVHCTVRRLPWLCGDSAAARCLLVVRLNRCQLQLRGRCPHRDSRPRRLRMPVCSCGPPPLLL